MIIGIPKETAAGEKRVACTPAEARRLRALGHEVLVETAAGEAAGYPDQDYREAGVTVCDGPGSVWSQADLICKVRPPGQHPVLGAHESSLLTEGKTLVSLYWPAQNPEMTRVIAAAGGTVIALDAIPRISRAQKMDVLSSMANVAGYRAVIEAGQYFERFFTGQITAAGKMPPAKVLVIGAGVAGLAAIGTAVSLGAMVRAFDTRPEAREQIESMNAEFLSLDFDEERRGEGGYARVMSEAFMAAEMALFSEQAREVDIIITTALVPGKPAPKLISEDMVRSMQPGSVIVDLAAEQGGNCSCTVPGQVIEVEGVTVIGHTDFPSRMARQSSQLFAANVRHLLSDLAPAGDGVLKLDLGDPVVRSSTIVREGRVLWPPPPVGPDPEPPAASPEPGVVPVTASPGSRIWMTVVGLAVGALAIMGMGAVAPPAFMAHFTVFVLACFVGWQVIWNVTPALHTPLMSVTNAISGIIVIGALLQMNAGNMLVVGLATGALVLSSINIFGGFLVTQRMLRMFRKE